MLNKQYALRASVAALALVATVVACPVVAGKPRVDEVDIRPITGPLPADYRLSRDGSVKLRICFNWSCAEQNSVTFSAEDMRRVKEALGQCAGQSLHDRIQRLRVGIWQMQLLAQKHLPQLANDREINEFDRDVEGRLDCVDSASNTNTYLEILQALGQLPGWTVAVPEVRNVLDLHGVHWTAVVIDKPSGRRWSVDSWFRPHGHLPFVMPLADWGRDKKAWDPPYANANPYPESVQDLCPPPQVAASTGAPEQTAAVATLRR